MYLVSQNKHSLDMERKPYPASSRYVKDREIPQEILIKCIVLLWTNEASTWRGKLGSKYPQIAQCDDTKLPSHSK